MPRARPLSARELVATLAHRQGLVERWRVRPAAAVERLVALQAQYPPAPYLALHARVAGFEADALQRALRRGTVVKSTLLRGTLHLVAATDVPALAGAHHAHAARRLRGGRNRERDLGPALEAELRAFLAEPRSTDEVRGRVAELTDAEAPGGPLDVARALVPHVHVPPSGDLRRHGKFRLRAWEGEVLGEDAGAARLAAGYLAAYGPASRADLAHFSGLGLRVLDAGLAALDGLRRLEGPDGEELLDLPRAPLRDGDGVLPSRLLGAFDHGLLAHRVPRLIDPADRERTLNPANGVWQPTFLVDGRVVGTWRQEGDVLALAPFDAGLEPPADLEAEALGVLRLLAPGAARPQVAWDGR